MFLCEDASGGFSQIFGYINIACVLMSFVFACLRSVRSIVGSVCGKPPLSETRAKSFLCLKHAQKASSV